MKAVILAGGEGRRLRPLTEELPKPMLAVCGRPVLEYILELLGRYGVDEAVLTLGYKSEVVIRHFPEGRFAGIRLQFAVEQRPLGTAGGFKNAVGAPDEDFIVISGDALCDFDLGAALAFHRAKGAEVTLISRRVTDPREFGLPDTAADGQVRGFFEKPGFNEAFTDWANTGVYIVSGLCGRRIPDGLPFDFAKDLFPKLVADGALFAFRTEGYWRDIGDLGAYLAAQQDLLEGRFKARIAAEKIGGSWFAGAKPAGSCVIEAPCYIGHGVRVGDGAVLGAGTVLEDGATVGARARTSGSVIMKGASLGEGSLSRGCIVCTGSSLGRNSTAATGSVVGPRSLLGEDAVMGENVVLSSFEVVPDETIMVQNLPSAVAVRPTLTADGIAGRLSDCITPAFCLQLGRLLADYAADTPVCLADDGMNVSYLHRQALSCGILAGGGQVYDTGVLFAGQLRFALSVCGAKIGVLVSGGGDGLRLVGGVPRSLQKQIEPLLAREFEVGEAAVCRLPESLSGLSALWENRLLGALPARALHFAGTFYCKNNAVAETAARLFYELGGRSDGSLCFSFSPDGSTAAVSRGGEILWSYEQLLMLCAKCDLEAGRDVVVTPDAPRVLDKAAAGTGGRVFRRPFGEETAPWLGDAVTALLYALSFAGDEGELAARAAALPEVGVAAREVETAGGTAAVMGRLAEREGSVRTGSGVSVPTAEGWVTVRPSVDGHKIRLSAESVSVEIARELCDDFEQWLCP